MDDTLGKALSGFVSLMFIALLPSLLTLTQQPAQTDNAIVVNVVWR